jgi:hypothetical protein
MEQNLLQHLEREVLAILKEEYTFYQTLYVTLDKQRDLIKYQQDGNLLDLFAEVERLRKRIIQSEEKITMLKDRHPEVFRAVSLLPDVRKVVNSITTLVKKNLALVEDADSVMRERYDRIRVELDQLKHSQKILQYMRDGEPSPQFIDGTK